MKRMLRASALILSFTACMASAAWAGVHYNTPVLIGQADGIQSHQVQGSLGTVHDSGDSREWIGCQIFTNNSATCFATNAAGQSRQCTTTFAPFIAAIATMNSDSMLIFDWNDNGTCDEITVIVESARSPKRVRQ